MSIKLEVGKRYVDREGDIAKVFARNDANKEYPFIVVYDDEPESPHTYAENGRFDLDRECGCDLIAEAPQTVDVWFVLNPKGLVIHSSLIEPKAEGYKIVGPVRVEVPL